MSGAGKSEFGTAGDPVTAANLARLDSALGGGGAGRAPSQARSAASFSQRASASMQSVLVESLIAVQGGAARLPTDARKAPLSVATTSVNFRGFVQKSGPMFYIQDSVEATLMWDDWPWTTMWMAIWAVLALNPHLFYCVPPVILIIVMCKNYFTRFPRAPAETDQAPGDALRAALQGTAVLSESPRAPPLEPRPVHEGELRFYMNMRDIQNMMRLVIDAYDDIAPLVALLNWSDVPRTLRLLQAAMVAAVALFFIGPYIPFRAVLLLGGEGALLANHPWMKPSVAAAAKRMTKGRAARRRAQRMRRLKQAVSDVLDEDRLPESVWAHGWCDMQVYENQRLRVGLLQAPNEERWSGQNLLVGERSPWTKGADGFSSPDATVDGFDFTMSMLDFALQPGWAWVEQDSWRIDWGGTWCSVGADEHGFVYTNSSWQNPAPYAYGTDKSAPRAPPRHVDGASSDEDVDDEDEDVDALDEGVLPPPTHRAVTRRRRWLRRAVLVDAERWAAYMGSADAHRASDGADEAEREAAREREAEATVVAEIERSAREAERAPAPAAGTDAAEAPVPLPDAQGDAADVDVVEERVGV
ncbi:hypothetical protein MSPP1_001395 [Malassezia sp. CBS 17886]|nr:hypothetical protein MSPP1_001395 [Malassezia sp. CBS 17886]